MPAVVRLRSPWLFALFRWYTRRQVRTQFHALRVSKSGPLPADLPRPTVVVLNHPSWWDPVVLLMLTGELKDREHYGPIDAEALRRYGFFRRFGLYAVEQGTTRGAAAFLRTSLALLERPAAVLWITGQGIFTDPRVRPVPLRPGVGHLARRMKSGCLLPLALEYPFWHERAPEALVRFGRPIFPAGEPVLSADGWTDRLAAALEETQDGLAEEACRQDPAAFRTLVAGRAGTDAFFDLWRRTKAFVLCRKYRPEHEEILEARRDLPGREGGAP